MDQKILTDYLGAVADLQSQGAIWSTAERFFAGHGFDKLIYIDISASNSVMMTSLPDAWVARYDEMGYGDIDPFLTHCCGTFSPVGTGVHYCDDYAYLTDRERQLINEASEFDFRAGFSSTVRKRAGTSLAGWNIGSSLPRREVEALRGEQEAVLRLVALVTHERLRQSPASPPPVLSAREQECLTWLIEGYRTKDIAQKLNLSAVAVELYIRNARLKLGARTRDQAVAKAILLGIIGP